MHGQKRSKRFQIKPPTGTAFAQLAPSQRAKPCDHRILDPNRGADCEIAFPIEGFLPDLGYEGFVERDSEERRRGTIAYPERKASVADVSLAMRDNARLDAVALCPSPVDFKGFAVMDCHDHLRGSEIPSLHWARGSVCESDRPGT